MTQVHKIRSFYPFNSPLHTDARLNSFYSPSYVYIETQHSPSTSPAAKPRESTPTYAAHVHVPVHQLFQLPTPVSSPRPSVRSPPVDPGEDQTPVQLRCSPGPRRSRFQPSLTAARYGPAQPRWHSRGGPDGFCSWPVQSIVQASIESYPDTQSCVPNHRLACFAAPRH